MTFALIQGGLQHEVKQYPMPIKGRPVNLTINGHAVEGRVTTARNMIYTYFSVNGGEFYVAGELTEAPATLILPEGFTPRQGKTREQMYEVTKANRQKKAAEAGESVAPKRRGRKTKEQAQAEQQWAGNGASA